jgi:hypothetical protein
VRERVGARCIIQRMIERDTAWNFLQIGLAIALSVIGLWFPNIPHALTAVFFICGLLFLILGLYGLFASKNAPLKPGLKIHFEPANTARRFFSLENNPNPDNLEENFPPYMEYRVEICNVSAKTVRNVQVTVEHIGDIPHRPQHRLFELTRSISYDIQPHTAVLVPVVRFNPVPRPGVLAGDSAEAYGPIKITASGDNVLPAVKIFQYNWTKEPAIYE